MEDKPYVHIPETVSPQAQSFLRTLRDPYAQIYAPGKRRHIHNALKAGATMEEIMEVLKLCVVQGVQCLNLGVPIFAQQLADRAG